jgi:hypothetical protein
MRLENAVPSNNLLQLSPNADFQVVKRPIYYKAYDDSVHSEDDIQQIPNRFALIRTDNEKCLGVVSPKYNVRQYKELVNKVNTAMFESLDGNITSSNVSFTDWTNPSGSKFKRDVYFWDKGIPVKDNYKEKTIPHLRIYASYDSTWAEQIIFGSVYVLCMNGMVRNTWSFNVYNRHSTNKSIDYTVGMFKDGLDAQKELGEELFKQIQRKVTHVEVEHLFRNTLAKTEQVFNTNTYNDRTFVILGDLWSKYSNSYGSNLFAVYQTATEWSSHPITKGSRELVKRKREQQVVDMLNSNYWLAMAA